MKNRNRGIVTIGLISLLLTTGACGPAPDSCVQCAAISTAADEAAIREVLDQIAIRFNAGDYEGMLELYREDVVVSAPGSADIEGKDSWLAGMRATLPPNAGLTLRFDTQEILVAGDLAYERGTFVVEAPGEGGARVPAAGGRHIHIFKRDGDGSWKGWRLFENTADAVPPTDAAPPTAAAVPAMAATPPPRAG